MTPVAPALGTALTGYVAVTLLALAPGIVELTSFVQRRLVWSRRFPVNSVYTILTLGAALLGCLLWPAQLGAGRSPAGLAAALVTGAVLVGPVTAVDAAIARRLAAALNRQARAVTVRPAPTTARPRTRVVPAGIAAGSSTAARPGARTSGTGRGTRDGAPWRPEGGVRRRQSLAWLVAVALAEELLFRGALLGWARGLPLPLTIVIAAVITVVFCLLHSGFGWHQVVAKAPLAVASLAVAGTFETVWGAVLLHALFNVSYWRRNSWLASSPVGTAATA